MKILGIIPSRFSSTRFPGKSLIDIRGKTMIRRVYDQSCMAKSLNDVIVATDDMRIEEEVKSFGGKVLITSADHKSGTDRCREVVDILLESKKDFDVVINIQGDEPYINPEQIDLAASCFSDTHIKIATLAKIIENPSELFSPHVNKVIWDKNHEALYFSRHPIPYLQNVEKDNWISKRDYYKHIGIYGYRTEILKEITQLKPSMLEMSESLEQLRWLENGYKIFVKETPFDSKSIDTPEDLLEILNNT